MSQGPKRKRKRKDGEKGVPSESISVGRRLVRKEVLAIPLSSMYYWGVGGDHSCIEQC